MAEQCDACPFRIPDFPAQKLAELAATGIPCHKTAETPDGGYHPDENSRPCVGAEQFRQCRN